MRLGFLTAPFPDLPLTDVADWAAANEFESLEIACWPRSTGPARRYAGTSHIDVANLSDGQATEIEATFRLSLQLIHRTGETRDIVREAARALKRAVKLSRSA